MLPLLCGKRSLAVDRNYVSYVGQKAHGGLFPALRRALGSDGTYMRLSLLRMSTHGLSTAGLSRQPPAFPRRLLCTRTMRERRQTPHNLLHARAYKRKNVPREKQNCRRVPTSGASRVPSLPRPEEPSPSRAPSPFSAKDTHTHTHTHTHPTIPHQNLSVRCLLQHHREASHLIRSCLPGGPVPGRSDTTTAPARRPPKQGGFSERCFSPSAPDGRRRLGVEADALYGAPLRVWVVYGCKFGTCLAWGNDRGMRLQSGA